MTPKEKMQYIIEQLPRADIREIRRGYRKIATRIILGGKMEDDEKWRKEIDNMTTENKKIALRILYQENYPYNK